MLTPHLLDNVFSLPVLNKPSVIMVIGLSMRKGKQNIRLTVIVSVGSYCSITMELKTMNGLLCPFSKRKEGIVNKPWWLFAQCIDWTQKMSYFSNMVSVFHRCLKWNYLVEATLRSGASEHHHPTTKNYVKSTYVNYMMTSWYTWPPCECKCWSVQI